MKTCLRRFVIVALAIAALTSGVAAGMDSKEVADAVRAAAPAAASMNATDWRKLATADATPKAEDLENQPLALMILTIRLPEKPTDAQQAEFRFATDGPPAPSKIAAAFQPTRFSQVTPLHSKYIKDVTADADGDQAKGVIAFEADGVYAGKISYAARRTAGKWKIVEFALPAFDLKTALGDDGKWRLERLVKPSAAPSEKGKR